MDDLSSTPADASADADVAPDVEPFPADAAPPADDGRPVIDAAEEPDADAPDATAPDAQLPDAEIPDATTPDALLPDALPPREITAERLCDGQDDDNDQLSDEGFECSVGAVLDCETACGSTGKVACLGGCTLGECAAPAELCNGRDDDCDDRIDQGYGCIQGEIRLCNPGCGRLEYQHCTDACEWTPCPDAPGCDLGGGIICDVDLDRDGFIDTGALVMGHLTGGVGLDEPSNGPESAAWHYDPVIEGGSTAVAQEGTVFQTIRCPDPDSLPEDGPAPIREETFEVYAGAIVFHGDGEFTTFIPFDVLDPEYWSGGYLYDVGPYVMVARATQLELYDRDANLLEAPIPGFLRPEFFHDPRPPFGGLPFEPRWLFLCGDHVVCATGSYSEPIDGWRPLEFLDRVFPDPYLTHFVRIDFQTGEMDIEIVEMPQEIHGIFDHTERVGPPTTAPDGRSLYAIAARPIMPAADTGCQGDTYEYAALRIDESGWHLGTYFQLPNSPSGLYPNPEVLEVNGSIMAIGAAIAWDADCRRTSESTAIIEFFADEPPRVVAQWPDQGPHPFEGEWSYTSTGSLARWDSHALISRVREYTCDGECPPGTPRRTCADEPGRCSSIVGSLLEFRGDQARNAFVHDWDGMAGAYGGIPYIGTSRDGMPYLMHSFRSMDAVSWGGPTGDIIQPIQCDPRRRRPHAE